MTRARDARARPPRRSTRTSRPHGAPRRRTRGRPTRGSRRRERRPRRSPRTEFRRDPAGARSRRARRSSPPPRCPRPSWSLVNGVCGRRPAETRHKASRRPIGAQAPPPLLPPQIATLLATRRGVFSPRMQTAAVSIGTILVVEDNSNLVELLRQLLAEHGFGVRSARDGEAGLASALEHRPDLVILDVGLPRRDGLEVVRELRRMGIDAPTLMLSGRAAVADRVSGLESGADDYLTKPFDPDELVARVRALLRRRGAHTRTAPIRVGD